MKKGFSLIEVLVGIFLALIVFLAVFAGYQLILKVVGQNRSRVAATSLASAELEKIRNLSYESIGVVGDYPDGVLEAETVKNLNGEDFTILRRVDFIVDEADGLESPEDDCPNDYKKAYIKVSWTGSFDGEVEMSTDIAPENIIQECAQVGGIFSVSVFDAQGLMVSNPLIEIKNIQTGDIIKTATPTEGTHLFSLPAETYRVEVSKTGYNSSRTYSVEEVTTPERPDLIVIEGRVTERSFPIDKISSLSVDTMSFWSADNFSDSFTTDSHISASSTISVQGGEVRISSGLSGYLISEQIVPAQLTSWEDFSWNDEEIGGTQISYQVLYFDGSVWTLIPEADLPGNSSGFSISPVDLSALNVSIYPSLKIKGNLETTDTFVSPVLYDWQLSWRTSEPSPISNVSFNLRGDKIIGKDSNDDPVYKYSQDHNSGLSAHVDILNLEWDLYTFTVDPATGLDLIETDPSPVSLVPDTALSVDLYLEAQNSLMITVQDQDTGEPVFSSSVRLYKTGYDRTQNTNSKGQAYFIPLEEGTYNIEISSSGFSDYSGTVFVSGDEFKIINITRLE